MRLFTKKFRVIVALIPIITILIFATYIVRGSVKLGYIPTPYNPDPKELGFKIHHYLINVGISTTFVSFIIWTGYIIMGNIFTSRLIAKEDVRVFLIYIVFILIIIIDPLSLVKWYLD